MTIKKLARGTGFKKPTTASFLLSVSVLEKLNNDDNDGSQWYTSSSLLAIVPATVNTIY